MSRQVVGYGPISFTDGNGRQHFIPLTALVFGDAGISLADPPPALALDERSTVVALANGLAANGYLTPGRSAPATPAMLLRAAIPGMTGNHITVTFDEFAVDLREPSRTSFAARVSATDTYQNLSVDPASPLYIGKVLGSGSQEGTRPTLVRVSFPDPRMPQIPVQLTPTPLENGDTDTKSSLAIYGTGSPGPILFTLEARHPGSDGQNIFVSITAVNSETFTLTVEWRRPPATGIILGTLQSQLDEISGHGLLFSVSPPTPGGAYRLPGPGTVTLSGGSNAMSATIASATVFAQ